MDNVGRVVNMQVCQHATADETAVLVCNFCNTARAFQFASAPNIALDICCDQSAGAAAKSQWKTRRAIISAPPDLLSSPYDISYHTMSLTVHKFTLHRAHVSYSHDAHPPPCVPTALPAQLLPSCLTFILRPSLHPSLRSTPPKNPLVTVTSRAKHVRKTASAVLHGVRLGHAQQDEGASKSS